MELMFHFVFGTIFVIYTTNRARQPYKKGWIFLATSCFFLIGSWFTIVFMVIFKNGDAGFPYPEYTVPLVLWAAYFLLCYIIPYGIMVGFKKRSPSRGRELR